MMGHPKAVKQWAKALKPAPTARQVQQAQAMREAKQRKRDFLALQCNLFDHNQSEAKS